MAILVRVLQVFEKHGRLRLPVVFVKRITARGQPGARRRCAVAESATDPLSLHLAAANHIQRKLWISEHHSSQPDAIDPAFAHRTLSDVRKAILRSEEHTSELQS